MSFKKKNWFVNQGGDLPLIFTIDTSLDVGTDFTIPTSLVETYDYRVDWGDGNVTLDVIGDTSHTYSTDGIYQISIYGAFPKFYFNNTSAYVLKITSVNQWGDIVYSTNLGGSFYGCLNLDLIADDIEWMNSITDGRSTFRDCKLTSLPSVLTLNSLGLGDEMFRDNNLTDLPSGMTLGSLTSSSGMFRGNSITSLPSVMDLSVLTKGDYMFYNNLLTVLPNNIGLDILNNGGDMFYNNNLTSLPSTVILDNLITGTRMFQNNSLTSLPTLMTLNNLTGSVFSMFQNNNLASLPNGMVLNHLGSLAWMFRDNNLTDLPSGMTLTSMTNGQFLFRSQGINTTRYSQLLIDMESLNVNNNVTFDGGLLSKYNASAVTARANLVTRGWIITDGGLE